MENDSTSVVFKSKEKAEKFLRESGLPHNLPPLPGTVCIECKEETVFKEDDYYDYVYNKNITTAKCCVKCGWWND